MIKTCEPWGATRDTRPPEPAELHVHGGVTVGNPGVLASLAMRDPQGINPAILLLDLQLVQQPGTWPQVETCAKATFDMSIDPGAQEFESVEIFHEGERIAVIDHIDVAN